MLELSTGYDAFGAECDVETNKCYAKAVLKESGESTFWVKMDGGLLIDPAEKIAPNHATLRRVNERAFAHYVNYLKSRKPALFQYADRAINEGLRCGNP